jgi:hypothetical protein
MAVPALVRQRRLHCYSVGNKQQERTFEAEDGPVSAGSPISRRNNHRPASAHGHLPKVKLDTDVKESNKRRTKCQFRSVYRVYAQQGSYQASKSQEGSESKYFSERSPW